MATHKQLKNEGIDVPNTFSEFVAGVKPMNINGPKLGPKLRLRINK